MSSTTNHFTNGSEYQDGYWTELEVAHEILDLSQLYAAPESKTASLATYKGAGSNPISSSVWENGYEVPYPYSKNTTRNLQFNESHFIASPGEPEGVTSYITTSDGYTWGAMSVALNAMHPFSINDYPGNMPPALNAHAAGNWVTDPIDGALKVTINYKAQNMLFYANDPSTGEQLERYFVRDPYDNTYIMHASGQDDPASVRSAFDAAVFPQGWVKYSAYLPLDLVVQPTEGVGGVYEYNLLRDSADSTYHQVGWGDKGEYTAKVSGFPIWGGQTNDVLYGTNSNNEIYAGAGNDVIAGGGGSDFIDGGDGIDTVLYGAFENYAVTNLGGGQMTVEHLLNGEIDTLNSVEKLKFDSEQLIGSFGDGGSALFSADYGLATIPVIPIEDFSLQNGGA